MQLLLTIYVVIVPIIVAENKIMLEESFFGLLVYDIVFMIDRFFELFVGFVNKEG